MLGECWVGVDKVFCQVCWETEHLLLLLLLRYYGTTSVVRNGMVNKKVHETERPAPRNSLLDLGLQNSLSRTYSFLGLHNSQYLFGVFRTLNSLFGLLNGLFGPQNTPFLVLKTVFLVLKAAFLVFKTAVMDLTTTVLVFKPALLVPKTVLLVLKRVSQWSSKQPFNLQRWFGLQNNLFGPPNGLPVFTTFCSVSYSTAVSFSHKTTTAAVMVVVWRPACRSLETKSTMLWPLKGVWCCRNGAFTTARRALFELAW